ncbi:unnamed protein product [Ostreobium quekettii]|uniref:FAD-binding PCMH-type domain-containing protein n=1 Tax=Ostreobium quekettii TaxID=121088 RepID=A0A8S1IPE6_9CHLO|nr:unnamed protein product [Ostreobium quekettii]|eukprot:evm.model.scf_103EXC.9 EVM.evm.TU.scf_103EXC.9   scf_103EXC:110235-112280(-)
MAASEPLGDHDVPALNLAGDPMTILGSKIAELAGKLRGSVVTPRSPGYDDARRVWNAMLDRRPALIARCTGTADVITAVNFARDEGLLTCVRSGGHSQSGSCMVDGAFVVDLKGMRAVRVDPAARVVWAQPGATLADIDHETDMFDLAVPTGRVSATGIGGLALNGGTGYLGRPFGLTVDNLRSADVVLADGSFVRASADSNPDLFWALRGAGGNFGIVTSFEFDAHPVGEVFGGMVAFPREAGKDLAKLFRNTMRDAPDNLDLSFALITLPDGTPASAIVACYCGPPEEGEALLRPVREWRTPVADLMGRMRFRGIQALFDDMGWSKPTYWKSSMAQEVTDGAIDVLVAQAEKMESPMSMVLIESNGGAVARVGETATSYPNRSARYSLAACARWERSDPEVNARHVGWAKETHELLRPHVQEKVYLGFLSDDGDSRLRDAYGCNYERLEEIKTKYDPANMFRHTANIKPKA